MRIGIFAGARREVDNLENLTDQVKQAETDGFSHFWVPHLLTFGYDALTALAVIGQQTSRIELGTAVVPTYPFHPLGMAQHALTAQRASNGRLALGIGLSHRPLIEGMMGLSYDGAAQHMEEYLSVLRPLVSEGRVDFGGDVYNVKVELQVPDTEAFPILVAALAPRMLRLTGELADGTITWMAGRKTVESHIVPRISAAAQSAGRGRPRVCVGLPIAVTDSRQDGHEVADAIFNRYGQLLNYRRLLDIEGVEGAADVAVVGNEAQVEQQLRAFASAGATDFLASVFPVGDDADGSIARTWTLLKSLNGNL